MKQGYEVNNSTKTIYDKFVKSVYFNFIGTLLPLYSGHCEASAVPGRAM